MPTLETGQSAPDFSLARTTGESVTLGQILARGPVLLVFYKVTCPTCQLALPFLQRLQGGNFQVVAVVQDPADRAAEFNRVFKVDLPTLIDPAADGYPASNAYGLTHVPSLFLVQPDRTISWSEVGFNKRSYQALASLAGRVIFEPGDNVPESKYG